MTLTHLIVCIFMLEILKSEDEKKYLKIRVLLGKMHLWGFLWVNILDLLFSLKYVSIN